MQDRLDDQTIISMPAKSWWLIFTFFGVLVTGYWSLKADTDAALKLSRETATKQEVLSDQLQSMKMNIQSITDNVRYFRETYERDKGRR